ncbi:RHS repeat protein, partial [Pedobacter hiemivivus]
MITRLRNVFTITCLLVLWGLNSFAAEEPYENFIKGAIKKNDSLFVKDEKFKNPNFIWSEITNISVNNTLSLSILSEQEISKSFNLHITLRVAYFSSPDQAQPTLIDSVKLHVNYEKGSGKVYKSMDNYRFTNGYYVKVYVVDVQSPEFGTEIPEIFQLTSTIVVNRKYKFMPQMPISVNGILQNDSAPGRAAQRLSGGGPINNNAQLELSWTPLYSGEEYDIEWVMLDKNEQNSYVLNGVVDGTFNGDPLAVAQFFKNNSTRVTTTVPLYTISLVSNADVILVRVRQVSYATDGIRLEGSWSYQKDNSSQYTAWDISSWHESKMNWQYAASYAEDGKKKEVVTYFDGTLRGRQTVTLNNAEKVAIVQENIYDQYGRVAASVLPAPAQESLAKTLHYFQNFNQNSAGKQYNFLNLNTAFCETLPEALKKSSGSSLYYSADNANAFKDDPTRPYNKYIPDAGGFPLSVTQYTADNTGRIQLQGGVGPAFQPGVQDSRTTKYFYGKPEQWELDRIFGNDVGDASHYLKNMVVDPNKQVSISYVNASGKTIATALTGSTPANLEALPSLPVVKRDTLPLITSGKFVFNSSALKLTANTTYLSSVIGAGTLKYNVEQLISRYPGGLFQPCSNCYYELKITVKDDCGDIKGTKFDTIGSIVAAPEKTSLHEDSLSVNFDKIGEYYITFELQLSKEVIKHFTDEFVSEGQATGQLKKESEFILNALEKARFEDCLADCKTAKERLGTQVAFTSMFNGKLKEMGVLDTNTYSLFIDQLYTRLSATVYALQDGCDTMSSVCDRYRIPMLADVSPGGQYALFDNEGNPLETDLNVLFKRFKNGVFNDLDETDPLYQKDLITLEDGSVISPYRNGFKLAQLVKYWRPEWAELFLDQHPEYCKLLFCYANTVSGSWDEKVSETSTNAKIEGFTAVGISYSDTNSDWLLPYDPFFKVGAAGEAYKPAMLADLLNYSQTVLKLNTKVPTASIKGLSQYVDYQLYCADSTATTNQFGAPSARWENCAKKMDCRVVDREWQMYRDMYLELKQKYFEQARSSSPGCTASCPVGTTISLPPNGGNGVNPCGVQFQLGASGLQLADNVFSNLENNIKNTYWFVSGMAGDPPNPPAGVCNNGYSSQGFYPCITVYLANGTPKNFYNVWMFICTETTEVPCFYETHIYGVDYEGYNFYVANSGSYAYRTEYTVIEGYDYNNMPPFNPSGNNCYAEFYQCLKIYHLSGNLIATYNNVWVFVCVGDNGWGRTAAKSAGSVENKSTDKLKTNNFTDSDKKINEILITDVSSKNVYSIIKGDSTAFGGGSGPVLSKVNFTAYEFKPYFVVQERANVSKRFKNVWVSKYVEVKVANRQVNNSVSSIYNPCPASDFEVVTLPGWENDGISISVSYKNGVTCPNHDVQVDIYRNPDALNAQYLGTVTIPASVNTTTAYLTGPTSTYPYYYDLFFACGTNPCANDPEPVSCSPLLLTKRSHFGAPNRADVSSQSPEQFQSDLKEQLYDLVKTSCESGADVWMERLKPGLDASEVPESTRNLLKAHLIDLCILAGDTAHPMGASSLPSGYIRVSNVPSRTFADVIKNLLGAFTPLLNPWLIDAPYPYNSGHQPVERTITNTSKDICDKLASLRPAGLSDPQFYTHLQNLFGTTMKLSHAEFDALLKACNNCRFILEKDIILPQFLESNSKACITKGEYNTAMSALLAEFNNSLTPESANYETIVSNYMNHKWGFSLTFDKYKAFGDGSNNQLCNELPYTEVAMPVYDCERSLIETAIGNGMREYEAYILDERNKFTNAYVNLCASAKANVKMLMAQQVYHYTLYYYDQAGNLIRTVPPEGVNVLNETETMMVSNARRFVPDNCNYNGPDTEANKPLALQSLSDALAYDGNAAVEMWLYQNNTLFRQMIATTSDKKYMFQACINGNLLNIDVYSLQQADAGSISITLSNHVTANIAALQPLLPWTHIVVQGDKLASGALQLWINGKLHPAVSGAPSAGCTWTISSIPSLSLPENISSLKHLRLYNGRLMTAEEIKSNAESGCLSAFGPYTAWHRFAVPTELGGPTAIAPNSTRETQFNALYPAHTLTTTYAYNSTNQVIKQESPDAGISRFWYDLQSRLVISQNARQAPLSKHSYTKYDPLGRITEVGEKLNGNLSQQDLPAFLQQSSYLNFLSSGSNSQLTQTIYDNAPEGGIGGVPLDLGQTNLRKRVAASIYRENAGNNNINASYYDYDLSGNVKTLYQQVNGLGIKKINYEYDLASGKVNFVAYQPSEAGQADKHDQFYYAYKYDDENRLTEAWSGVEANMVSYGIGSKLNLVTGKEDASYRYYLHGPLARVDLGREGHKVQGLDYAYTLQGWLKGVNGNTLQPGNDQGGDGTNGIARDAMAYSLGYYPNDYQPIGGGLAYNMQWQPGGEAGNALFNGNISNSTVAIKGISNDEPKGYTYAYDQLNRLTRMRQHDLSNSTTSWNGNGSDKYKEDYTYDGNGNILTLQRNGSGGSLMDSLSYT